MPRRLMWPLSRDGSNNSKNRPFRRRRSLLGRKNRSENDLPQQDPLSPQSQDTQQQQQQQQQQQLTIQQMQEHRPHTTLVLPENVKTILIAGTPECWNLSTCAESFEPTTSNCDASLATLTSDLTLNTTIDEEGPYSNERLIAAHDQLQHGDLDWMRAKQRRSSSSRELAKRGSAGQQQSPVKGPSSMVVVYQSPSTNPGSPQEALHIWLSSVEVLMKSKEMAALVTSTRDVVMVAGGLVVKTAFLPVTFPLHVACATRDFVGWTLHQALSQTGAILHLTDGREGQEHPKKDNSPTVPKTVSGSDKTITSKEQKGDENPLGVLLHVVPAVLETAAKVKDEIGSVFIGLLTPPQPRLGHSSEDFTNMLERLRIPDATEDGKLDFLVDTVPIAPGATRVAAIAALTAPPSTGATKADFSKYLLRVEDLGIDVLGSSDVIILYIDLSAEFRDTALLTQCLDQLAAQALAIATSHAPSIPPAKINDASQVEWKPEGATAKLLRKKARQTPERWQEIMTSEVLIWCGNFKKQFGGSDIHREFPLFLARGVVDRLSPRAFLELLWDNARTGEYNHFCMGRSTLLEIDDEVLSPKRADRGVKVVRSETRVPYTGLSVTLCTVMHCRALPGGPEEGYYIVSRSLVSGMAGSHTSKSSNNIHKSKSEILWGVNVLRSVPGQPGQTELISASQVASTMVPRFLSQKIGVMGIEDFFRNVRHAPKVPSSPPAYPSKAQVKAPVSPRDATASTISI